MPDIKRLNYFNSQFLIDRDFRDEQAYHLGLRRMLNRALHRWGVAEGLSVTKTAAAEVTVSPGLAIDAAGNEIVLTEPRALSLAGSTPGADLFVTIAYEEVNDPADLYTSGSLREYTRRTERPRVDKAASAPPADGAVLVLARVRLDGAGTVSTINPYARRNASSAVAPETDLQVRSLTLMRQEMPSAQWATLDLEAANQAKLGGASLRLDAGRELFFNGAGQLRSSSDARRIVFNPTGNRLELHEAGDTVFLNGATPVERMRVTASGNVGVRDPRAGARLSVGGADATAQVETSEVLRLFRPSVANVKNANSVGLFVGAFEPGPAGAARLDVRLSGAPNAGNEYGYTPNVNALTLLGNGNVGLCGVTAPVTALHLPAAGLQIGANATAADNFHFTSDLNGPRALRLYNGNYGTGSMLVTVLPSGRVGLGLAAANPVAPLQIGALTTVSHGASANGAWANIGSNCYFDGAWRRIDPTKAGANLHINGDGDGTEFRFYKADANSGRERNIAFIGTQATAFVEGKVGIGTSEPIGKLHVVGGAIVPAVGNSESAGIQWPLNPGGGALDQAFIRYYVESGETTRLLIGIENDADDTLGFWQMGAERMNIVNGNVAIGTRNTNAKLHVAGNPSLLTLEGTDHGYINFYPFGYAAGRKAWLGFGNPNNNSLNIINEATGGNSNGRIHLDGADGTYVLSGEGLIVSRAWRGSGGNAGRLIVEGEAKFGGTRTDVNGYDGSGYHWVRENGDENKMWFAFRRSGTRGRNIEFATAVYVNGQYVNSDERLKTDIRPLEGVLDKLALLRGVSYREVEREEPAPGQRSPRPRRLGVVAQELEAVFPELVSDADEGGYKAVAYHGLTGVLIEAGKELKAENDALRRRIEALERLVGATPGA